MAESRGFINAGTDPINAKQYKQANKEKSSIDAGTDPVYGKNGKAEKWKGKKKSFTNGGKGPTNSKKPKITEKETVLVNAGTDPISVKKSTIASRESSAVDVGTDPPYRRNGNGGRGKPKKKIRLLPGEDDPYAPGETAAGVCRKPKVWRYNRKDSDEPLIIIESGEDICPVQAKIASDDQMWDEIERRIRHLEEDDKKAPYRKKKTKYLSPEELAVYKGDRSVTGHPRRDRPSKKVSLEIIEISDLPIEWYTMKRQLRKKGESNRGSVYAVDAETSLLLSEYAAKEQAERGHKGRKGSEVDPETARLLRQFAAEDLMAARRHRKSSLDPETAYLLQKYEPESHHASRQHKRKPREIDPDTEKLIEQLLDDRVEDPRRGPGHNDRDVATIKISIGVDGCRRCNKPTQQ